LLLLLSRAHALSRKRERERDFIFETRKTRRPGVASRRTTTTTKETFPRVALLRGVGDFPPEEEEEEEEEEDESPL